MKILYNTITKSLQPYPRQDDQPVVGLASEYQVFSIVESPPPAYNNETHYLCPTETINVTSKTVTRGFEAVAKPPPPPAGPPVVTIGTLRIAMGRDICIAIGAWIQAIADAGQKHEAMSWWEYQPYVRRDHPVVEQFRLALNKTTEEVDAWFAAAKQLDAM